jgi:hypothetical protein
MKARLGLLLAVTVVLPAVIAGPVPNPGGNQIYIFASPATQESIADGDAKARLNTFAQINATAVADRAACALSTSVQITDSLGIYDKSSENSFILGADLEQVKSEYLAALLGLYSRQEFVLLFLDKASGHDRLWIIKTPLSLEVVAAKLRKLKLTPVTVRPEKNQNEIWFVDFGEKRTEALNRFTAEVMGRATATSGAAEMLGNQSRATALKEWTQQISAFEKQSGSYLSGQLSSKAWRGATAVHTCSKEMSTP